MAKEKSLAKLQSELKDLQAERRVAVRKWDMLIDLKESEIRKAVLKLQRASQ